MLHAQMALKVGCLTFLQPTLAYGIDCDMAWQSWGQGKVHSEGPRRNGIFPLTTDLWVLEKLLAAWGVYDWTVSVAECVQVCL